MKAKSYELSQLDLRNGSIIVMMRNLTIKDAIDKRNFFQSIIDSGINLTPSFRWVITIGGKIVKYAK